MLHLAQDIPMCQSWERWWFTTIEARDDSSSNECWWCPLATAPHLRNLIDWSFATIESTLGAHIMALALSGIAVEIWTGILAALDLHAPQSCLVMTESLYQSSFSCLRVFSEKIEVCPVLAQLQMSKSGQITYLLSIPSYLNSVTWPEAGVRKWSSQVGTGFQVGCQLYPTYRQRYSATIHRSCFGYALLLDGSLSFVHVLLQGTFFFTRITC